MKTTTKFSRTIWMPFMILLAMVTLQMSHASGKNPMEPLPPKVVCEATTLAPVAPREADFNDIPPVYPYILTTLAPVAPKEATFDDSDSDESTGLPLRSLLPVAPKEADFIDSEVSPSPAAGILAPELPVEASFDDTI